MSKKYSLTLPEELYEEVASCAIRKGQPVIEKIRRYMKLGLMAEKRPLYTQNENGEFVEIAEI